MKMPNPFYMKDRFGSWILILKYTVVLEDESYREHVDHTQLVACNDDYEVGNSHIQVYKGTTNFALRTELLESFAGTVIGATMEYDLDRMRGEGTR